MAAGIRVEDIYFSYEHDDEKETGDWTVAGASFEIKAGDWVAMIGHNGSGKSTLAKLIDGLLEAEKGKIIVDGLTLSAETLWDIRSKIGLVFQNPDNQFVGATVEDDVAFGLENQGLPRPEMQKRVACALEEVGMSAFKTREPANLSGGQKQRVALAGILAMQPEIIILDEATAMLDPEGRSDVLAILKRIKAQGDMTILSITHDINEAALADQLLVVNQGQILDQGAPETIFQQGEALLELDLDVPFSEKLRLKLAEAGGQIPDAYEDERGLLDWLCQFD